MKEFVTKDSGAHQSFSTGMVRDVTVGKMRPDLIYQPMLIRWAGLMARGAEKYGARNWEQAATETELERFKESAFRHFVLWFNGLDQEEDHAAAVFFNISGAEHTKRRLEEAAEAEIAALFKKEAEKVAKADLDRAANQIRPSWEPDPFKAAE